GVNDLLGFLCGLRVGVGALVERVAGHGEVHTGEEGLDGGGGDAPGPVDERQPGVFGELEVCEDLVVDGLDGRLLWIEVRAGGVDGFGDEGDLAEEPYEVIIVERSQEPGFAEKLV